MVCHMLLTHLVHLQTGSLGRGWSVGDTCSEHSRSVSGPFACRHLPFQFSVILHLFRQVDNFPGLCYQSCLQRFGLCGPHIPVPHRQRALEHLAQRLLFVAFHQGLFAQCYRQFGGLTATIQCQAKILSFHIGNTQADWRQGMKTYVRIMVGSVQVLRSERLILTINLSLQRSIHEQVGRCFKKNTAQCHRFVQMNIL